MALESSSTILYVAKISYQSHNWYGNCWGGGPKFYTDTHTEAHFISPVFLQKCRNKTKNNFHTIETRKLVNYFFRKI